MNLQDRLAAVDAEDRPGGGRVATIVASQPPDRWRAAKRAVRSLVLEELAGTGTALDAAALRSTVRSTLDEIAARDDLAISPTQRRTFIDEMLSDLLGYGPIDHLLADATVTEIMCNRHDEIWVERRGRIEPAPVTFEDEADYRRTIERIVSAVGRRVDESSPMVDARLPDGSRVNAVVPPLALRGPVLTIRKFPAAPMTRADLIAEGTWSPELAAVLEACVRGRLNVLVSGGTGTGKTTNLNVMSSFVPGHERIITIEDSAELQLQQRHVVGLEARPGNAEGSGAVAIRDLVRNALRMRPDRIIVGECRSSEALDMLQAMNTGHEGSMTTVHANSPRDALRRLEVMVMMAGLDLPIDAIREQIAAAIDVVVQCGRTSEGKRIVASVSEVGGVEGTAISMQEVFRSDPATGAAPVPTGLRPRFVDRLGERGIAIELEGFAAGSER